MGFNELRIDKRVAPPNQSPTFIGVHAKRKLYNTQDKTNYAGRCFAVKLSADAPRIELACGDVASLGGYGSVAPKRCNDFADEYPNILPRDVMRGTIIPCYTAPRDLFDLA